MATIKDIAKKTNLSITTVSRVLSYDPSLSVTHETKQKVFETAEKLNYTKHIRKKQRRDEAITNIAIIQWLDAKEEIDDIYYMSIRIGVEKRAAELGLNLLKMTTIKNGLPNNIEGILAIGKFDQQSVDELTKLNKNVVFIGNNHPLNGFDTINGDFSQATEIALTHLIEKGHKRIGFIGAEDKKHLHGYRKYKSPAIYTFIDYLKSKNLFDESLFFFTNTSEPNTQVGYRLMNEALTTLSDNLPTAFFAVNDEIALGCLNALREHKLRVPDDVSIISINDLSISQFLTPALTTVKVYTEEMGELGINTLKERMESEGNPIAKRITLSTKLIERDTVKDIISEA
ncbi:LacI family DNA-binding transcriptional regulator [Amphibacillus sp. MSJ-3]|uniref:LacI family DNA-binding transcriptional regulator n=1 Tax=Amphibacillus sp. MSJ-3 TaxID=2841505 RepID=UPI001C0EC1DE|nr:LacI family DNA-binding transcriptional regulator [Amphibacillus sp. MSJ-3]MBU5593935.1 LacI family DNA-binding transcriptional regulator [Amphibacillus sp. MSJ-3]